MDYLDVGCYVILIIFILIEINFYRLIYFIIFSKYVKVWKNYCRFMEICNFKFVDFLFDIKCMF